MEQESVESVIDSGKTRAGGRRSMIERAGGVGRGLALAVGPYLPVPTSAQMCSERGQVPNETTSSSAFKAHQEAKNNRAIVFCRWSGCLHGCWGTGGVTARSRLTELLKCPLPSLRQPAHGLSLDSLDIVGWV